MLRRAILAAAVAFAFCAPSGAQEAAILPESGPIRQPQMIDLNLMESLVTCGATDLAGVFGFVAPENAPFALADYLLHNRKALKKLTKNELKNLKETGGVGAWNKLVFMQILQIENAGILPPGVEKLSKSEEQNVSELVLAKGMTLAEMAAIRGAKQ
ncbi:MAG: hypothetical protein HY925_03300 [Elusimicrobia bacterium]|nr:hypothetical protein [Elusimicrobiota bacterium]